MSGIAITFPSSPSEGQSYLAQNGFTYIYDSNKNRWKRGGEFVRSPKVLSYAGVAVTTTGSGITTGPTGALIYNIPEVVTPNSTVGVDSYKAYRAADSYPNYTEVQVSISSDFSSVAYAATFTGTTHTLSSGTLSGDTTYYLRARQFVGSDAASAGVGAISGYSANIVSFATTSTYIDTPVIVSVAGTTSFPVYQILHTSSTLPATVEYDGSGVGNLEQVDWRVTGPRNPTSTGDTALAEIGIGTHSSVELANALVLALPFSGATGVGITDDVNNAIRTASGASSGTTKTLTANGDASIATIAGLALTSHFYDGAAYFDGSGDYVETSNSADFVVGTGDFTIEGWFNPNATQTGNARLFGQKVNDSSNWDCYINSTSGTNGIYMHGGNTNLNMSFPSANNWHHFAICRSGTTLYSFMNGSLKHTQTYTNSVGVADYGFRVAEIGPNGGSGYTFNGYIQDFKFYKGLAKYTENFTPPLPTYGTISYTTGITNVGVTTTAFYQSTGDVGIAETTSTAADALVFAMPMNKTFGFQDINVSIRGLTSGASAGTAKTVGLGTTSTANAPSHPRISSTESKWYDGAALFDNFYSPATRYLTIPQTNDFAFGTGDFTIEFWYWPINITTYTTSNPRFFRVTGGIDLTYNASINGALRLDNSSGTVLTSSSSYKMKEKTWNHIVYVRDSGTSKIYLNGVLNDSASDSTNYTTSGTAYISLYDSVSAGQLNGYLQDLKVYKGFAKYTEDFTPPQPICGFSTDISTQTGFTTTTASGALLSSTVGLGSTSTLAFDAGTTYAGIATVISSSGITTLTDPYASNLVLALPLADITGAGTSFTNDRNTQIRSVSLVGGGTTKTVTNSGVSTNTTSKWYSSSPDFTGTNRLYTANSVDYQFGTGDFTIEFWIYPQTVSGYDLLVKCGDDTTWQNGWACTLLDGKTNWWSHDGSTGAHITSSTVMSANTWNHVAWVRKNGVLTQYTNGAAGRSDAVTHNLVPDDNLTIGNDYTDNSYPADANIQDVRIYKGVAKYTRDFTPPPPMFGDYVRDSNKIVFTPGSDYVLEAKNVSSGFESVYSSTRQWGTIVESDNISDPFAENLVLAIPGGAKSGLTTTFDVSANIKAKYEGSTYSNGQSIGVYTNKNVTNNGVETSTTQSKYYGNSLYFTGSDYLRTPVSGDSLAALSSFTVECWIWVDPSALTDNQYGDILKEIDGGGTGKFVLGKWRSGISNKIYFSASSNPWSAQNVQTISDISASTWYHVAGVRDGNVISLFLDGVLQARVTQSLSMTAGVNLQIGNSSGGHNGYINDIRFYRGIAKYRDNFTPPNQFFSSYS